MKTDILIYEGLEIPYQIKHTKRKTVGIKITKDAVVVISAPYNMKDHIIKQVVKEKSGWIHKKITQIRLLNEKLVDRCQQMDQKILFLGSPIMVIFDTQSTVKQWKVVIKDSCLYFTGPTSSQDINRQRILQKWLTLTIKKIIEERVAYFSHKIGVDVNMIRIKSQKTRWGSCSSLKNINFNWKLSMAPLEVIDYVVVHELCHLKEMNHSKDFWLLVENILPDYKNHKLWLKKNSDLMDESFSQF